MSLEQKAVKGALWTISTGVGTRAIGLVGTLALTRFLSQDAFGEVAVAQVVVLTVSMFSSFGAGQFIVAHPKAPRSTVFHASLFYTVVGLIALVPIFFLRDRIAAMFNAPAAGVFLPGLIVSAVLDRLSFLPERILVRDMRFRLVSIERSAGELAYTAVSVGLAFAGWGGDAIVVGSVARGLVKVLICLATVERRDWLELHRLEWLKLRELLAFGVPLSVGNWAHFASAQWDNLVVSRLFGPGVTGAYKLAYNLADIPAAHVGEQIGDVLLPSFAHMAEEQRRAALSRAMAMLGLVVYPLAIGLGAVAESVVAALLDPKWGSVAPMLTVLSVLSVARPVGWIINSYLQAHHRTRPIMVLEVLKAALLVVTLVALGRFGPLWACTAVGITYGTHAAASLWVVRRSDGIPVRSLVAPLVGPLVACAPLVAAVLGVRRAAPLLGPLPAALLLVAEIVAGGAAYVLAAFVVAPTSARDMVHLVKRALRRGKDL